MTIDEMLDLATSDIPCACQQPAVVPVKVVPAAALSSAGATHQMICVGCYASGPTAATADEAARLWAEDVVRRRRDGLSDNGQIDVWAVVAVSDAGIEGWYSGFETSHADAEVRAVTLERRTGHTVTIRHIRVARPVTQPDQDQADGGRGHE
ncbi:hypothetical protein P7L78_22100 [Tistrella bauzanensis]|uniref:hypothetical protein n=1 Tax=Tistrella TaxID=171436 RepID=UPI0031F5F60A